MFLSRICQATVLLFFNVSAFAFPGSVATDDQLVNAINSRKNAYYLEAANLTVTEILPDDTKGSPHQKWEAKLSDGHIVMIVYNSDMGRRVPIKPGDVFSVGGEYIYTRGGGLVHWVHSDPRHKRPDGYVYLDGIVYGDGLN